MTRLLLLPILLAALLAVCGSAVAQTQPLPPPSSPPPTHPQAPHKPPPRHESEREAERGHERVPVIRPAPHPVKHPVAAERTEARPAAPPAPRAAAKPAAPPVPAPAPPPASAAAADGPEQPPIGSVTKLPLPRWASLRTDDVNLRTGPGMRYPIDWVYKRRDLPVQIEREFDVWRLVEDPDGVKGWVQQATLVGRRSFIVTGADRTMRDGPQDTASPVAILKPGVIGRIRSCAADAAWCEVQVGDYHGWLKRTDFWGAFPGEAVQ